MLPCYHTGASCREARCPLSRRTAKRYVILRHENSCCVPSRDCSGLTYGKMDVVCKSVCIVPLDHGRCLIEGGAHACLLDGLRCILHFFAIMQARHLIHLVSPFAQVLTLAVSSDGRYLASGGRDRLINVWDCRTDSIVETFRGHQDTVSSLAFRANSLALFSGSHDRCVKVRKPGCLPLDHPNNATSFSFAFLSFPISGTLSGASHFLFQCDTLPTAWCHFISTQPRADAKEEITASILSFCISVSVSTPAPVVLG